MNDNPRIPDELFCLLKRWGRVGMTEGGPRLKYPSISDGFAEWYPPASSPLEPPRYDRHEYEMMCEIIDTRLQRYQQALLENFFRHGMNKRQSAEALGGERLGWYKKRVGDEFYLAWARVHVFLNNSVE